MGVAAFSGAGQGQGVGDVAKSGALAVGDGAGQGQVLHDGGKASGGSESLMGPPQVGSPPTGSTRGGLVDAAPFAADSGGMGKGGREGLAAGEARPSEGTPSTSGTEAASRCVCVCVCARA